MGEEKAFFAERNWVFAAKGRRNGRAKAKKKRFYETRIFLAGHGAIAWRMKMDGPRHTTGAGGRPIRFNCQITAGRRFEHLAARKMGTLEEKMVFFQLAFPIRLEHGVKWGGTDFEWKRLKGKGKIYFELLLWRFWAGKDKGGVGCSQGICERWQ